MGNRFMAHRFCLRQSRVVLEGMKGAARSTAIPTTDACANTKDLRMHTGVDSNSGAKR
jgi:hypothetical protein